MPAIGIDLGTSNSVVAVYRRGQAEVIPIDGRSVMPSCVAAKPSGELIVGELAKRRALIDPGQAVRAIKREMGSRDYFVELAGKQYNPIDISSLILQKLVNAASEQLGEPVKDAVISVPAYFTNNQKEDTRLAGEKAGLNVLRLMPEPTAAAVAYGINKGRDQDILVYDLGGGTFDVSIVRVRGNNFEVVGIGGDHNLGGEDFDHRLIDLIIAHLRRNPDLANHLANADAEKMQQQLKESAEAAKKELSSAELVEIEIPQLLGDNPFCLNMTRLQYEASIQDLVNHTIDVTMETLKNAGLSPDEIDRVVLVGGSTRLPIIQKMIGNKIVEPYIADHVDEVVAMGAAIMAANLSSVSEVSGTANHDFAPIEVTNITAHSLGIRAADDSFAEILPRGTSLPAKAHKVFTTALDNADRTDIVVFQGQAELCSDNQQIGGFGLTGIERATAGKPQIEVNFAVDQDDILTVSARDLGTGRAGDITIEKFEPQPYEPDKTGSTKDLKSLRFASSKKGCDDAAQVIRKMGHKCTILKHRDFRTEKILQQYDLVFINCLADVSQAAGTGIWLSAKKNASALRKYVEQGGILYVSDFALDNISEAFPGKIKFQAKGAGPSGKILASVIDDDLSQLVGSTYPINFDTVYAPVDSVTDNCHVYIAKEDGEPILVSFRHGDGHVVYTSFHNGAQVSEKETQLLMFIILQTISLATSTPLVELAETANLHRL